MAIGWDRVAYSHAGTCIQRLGTLITPLISYRSIGLLVGAAEGSVIVLGSALVQIGFDRLSGTLGAYWDTTFGVGVLTGLLYVLSCRTAGLYRLPALLNPAHQLKRILMVCAFVLLSLVATLFLLRIGSQLSCGSTLGFAAGMLLLSCLTRIGAAGVIEGLMRRNAIAGRPAFLIGEGDELAALATPFLLRHFGLQEIGRLAVDADAATPFTARVEDAISRARACRAKEFVVATKWSGTASLSNLETSLRCSPLPVTLIPCAEFRGIIGRNPSSFATSAYTVELQRAPMGLAERISKRTFDIVVALFAIAALLPIFMIAACAVKLDSPGPIIFRQRRNGFDRNEFVIFKFRTMRVQEDGAVVRQAQRNDDRITPVGKFLRRTSIDELPQLLNVLQGNMSIVGPRPHAIAHDQQYMALIGDYGLRHHVKPGITGWAQIKGCRGETAAPEHMQQRVDFDLWYIRNWSFGLDLHILFRTALDVVKHDAY